MCADADETTAAQPPLTNGDRLRSHLKSGGLANVLLDAWENAGATEKQAKLLAALKSFDQRKEQADAEAAPQPD